MNKKNDMHDDTDPFADEPKEQNVQDENVAAETKATEHDLELERKIQQLEDDINTKEEKNKELKELLMRMKAEMANLEKRKSKEIADASNYAITSVLKDLVTVLDSFDQALNHEVQSDEGKAVLEGMQLTADMFLTALKKHGVGLIEPQTGDVFDPNQHEAISMQKDEQFDSGAIITVIQPGYKLNDRVIRAARVIVNQ